MMLTSVIRAFRATERTLWIKLFPQFDQVDVWNKTKQKTKQLCHMHSSTSQGERATWSSNYGLPLRKCLTRFAHIVSRQLVTQSKKYKLKDLCPWTRMLNVFLDSQNDSLLYLQHVFFFLNRVKQIYFISLAGVTSRLWGSVAGAQRPGRFYTRIQGLNPVCCPVQATKALWLKRGKDILSSWNSNDI